MMITIINNQQRNRMTDYKGKDENQLTDFRMKPLIFGKGTGSSVPSIAK